MFTGLFCTLRNTMFFIAWQVQCAFCRGVAGQWEEGDIPLIEHRRHFPRCPFICHLPVGNQPIDENEPGIEVHPFNATDEAGPGLTLINPGNSTYDFD